MEIICLANEVLGLIYLQFFLLLFYKLTNFCDSLCNPSCSIVFPWWFWVSLYVHLFHRVLLLVRCSIQLTFNILLQHHLSSVCCSAFLSIHVSQPYSFTLHTYTFMERFLTLILMLLEHNNFFLFINADITYERFWILFPWRIFRLGWFNNPDIWDVPLIQAADRYAVRISILQIQSSFGP